MNFMQENKIKINGKYILYIFIYTLGEHNGNMEEDNNKWFSG